MAVNISRSPVRRSRLAVTSSGFTVLGDVADANVRRVVVELGRSVVDLGRLIVTVSGLAFASPRSNL